MILITLTLNEQLFGVVIHSFNDKCSFNTFYVPNTVLAMGIQWGTNIDNLSPIRILKYDFEVFCKKKRQVL